MDLDEQAINAVKDYFDAIAQNALDDAYATVDPDVTFAQFMETLFQRIDQYASEHVAAEILHLSPKSISNYNSGGGVFIDDIQERIDTYDDEELDEEEDE